MAKIVKLIWRLDYKPSYAYLDARGTALRVLSDTVQKFWDAVGDGVIHMSFAARHADEDTLRSFSLETTAMVGTLEWRTGTELALVLEGRQFRGFDRIARELLNVCEVRDVARAGVRIFGMERYRGGRKHALERTVGFLDDSIREAATSALGPITDIGIIFEGVTTDNVGYRAVHGPYDKKTSMGSWNKSQRRNNMNCSKTLTCSLILICSRETSHSRNTVYFGGQRQRSQRPKIS
jgi:hypothetical protein